MHGIDIFAMTWVLSGALITSPIDIYCAFESRTRHGIRSRPRTSESRSRTVDDYAEYLISNMVIGYVGAAIRICQLIRIAIRKYNQ